MPKPSHRLSDLTAYFAKHRWPWHLAFWLLHAAGRAFAYYITVLFYSKEVLILMLISELVFVGLVYFTVYLYKRLSKLNLVLIGTPLWLGYVALLSSSQIYFLGALPEMSELRWSDSFIGNIKPYLITFILLVLAKYFKDSFIKQWHDERQEKLQLQSELQNLKDQVSPHFLFNTMNNFYGLAVAKSDKLPDLMVRLSDLLRYSLYETQSATVPLHSEVSYLENYIALEKIRLEDDMIFDFQISIDKQREFRIAPLLLIILVENAFKHAKSMVTSPIKISLQLSTDQDGQLRFEVQNNCRKHDTRNTNDKGLGLRNLRKRLEALYPQSQHELITEQKGELFQASLHINLKHLMA